MNFITIVTLVSVYHGKEKKSISRARLLSSENLALLLMHCEQPLDKTVVSASTDKSKIYKKITLLINHTRADALLRHGW